MPKRVLVVIPYLLPTNGGNGLGAWVCEALHREHDVTLLARERPDLAEVNRGYGTSLTPETLAIRIYEPPGLLEALPFRLTLVRGLLLSREARRIGRDFDVAISIDDETDLGGRGIQYVHFPRFRLPRPSNEPRRWFHLLPVLRAYYRLAALVTGFSLARMRRNFTLVNSDWTGGLVRKTHGIGSTTVFPPASGEFPDVPWEKRAQGFVLISRLHPDKRIDLAIAIVSELRRRGHNLTMHIVAAADDAEYGEEIAGLARTHADWLRLDSNIPRSELARIASSHRFGIHAAAEEHFGMSVAELVRAGCIVFVPRGGGQVEIVNGDERLTYVSADDAVTKIARVLADAGLERELREALAARRDLFSSARFAARIRKIVNEW